MGVKETEEYCHIHGGTGIYGVTYHKDKKSNIYSYYCSWTEIDPTTKKKIKKKKSWSCNKYGREEAFKMASDFRKEMEEKHMKDGKWIRPA